MAAAVAPSDLSRFTASTKCLQQSLKYKSPVWVLFYLRMVYTKYHEIAGFAFCSKVQVSKPLTPQFWFSNSW